MFFRHTSCGERLDCTSLPPLLCRARMALFYWAFFFSLTLSVGCCCSMIYFYYCTNHYNSTPFNHVRCSYCFPVTTEDQQAKSNMVLDLNQILWYILLFLLTVNYEFSTEFKTHQGWCVYTVFMGIMEAIWLFSILVTMYWKKTWILKMSSCQPSV